MNPAEFYRIRSSPGAARSFVDRHVAKETVTPENIYDGRVVEGFARGKQLRLQCVQNDFAVEGRKLTLQAPVGYNGVVHVVEKVLDSSATSVEDLIRRNESFR